MSSTEKESVKYPPERYFDDPSDECHLSEQLTSVAESELSEKPEWRSRDVAAFRKQVYDVPGLTSRLDYNFLIRFLRLKRFDYDQSLTLLKRYYSTRDRYRSLLESCGSDAEIIDLFRKQMIGFFAGRDANQRRVMFIKSRNWIPLEQPVDRIIFAMSLCLELLLEDEDTQVAGVCCLTDLGQTSIWNMSYLTLGKGRILLNLIQNSLPCRLKGMHFYREPRIFDVFYQLIRPFISGLLVDRIHFHSDRLESVSAALGPALPRSLNGTAPEYDVDECVDRISQFLPRYRQMLNKFRFSTSSSSSSSSTSADGSAERRPADDERQSVSSSSLSSSSSSSSPTGWSELCFVADCRPQFGD